MMMLILPPQEDQVGCPDATRPEESHSMAIDKNGRFSKLLHSFSDSGSSVLSKPLEGKEQSSNPERVQLSNGPDP